jgi:hypothetical protein
MKFQIVFLKATIDQPISFDALDDVSKQLGMEEDEEFNTLGIWSMEMDSMPELYAWVTVPELGMPVPVSMHVQVCDVDPRSPQYKTVELEAFGIVLCKPETYASIERRIKEANEDSKPNDREDMRRLWSKAEALPDTHPFSWFGSHP